MQVGREAVKIRKKISKSLELLWSFKFQYKLYKFEILLKEACCGSRFIISATEIVNS